MKLTSFKIGQHFFTHTGQWQCTDVGSRTILAVRHEELLKSGEKYPPYSIVEYYFDEYDIEGCWQAQDIEGVDLDTFQFMFTQDINIFCCDKNHIFKNDDILYLEGDKKQFEYLNSGYYKDDRFAYYENQPLKDADAKTFQHLVHQFARDKSNLYLYGNLWQEVNVDHFELLSDGLFKDDQSLYFGSDRIDNISLKDFQYIGGNLAVFNKQILYFNNKHFTIEALDEVDCSSLIYIKPDYFKDEQFDYHFKDDNWIKMEHCQESLRLALKSIHRHFFTELEDILFRADLLNIADRNNEYALERDEILMALPKLETTQSLKQNIIKIFNHHFEGQTDNVTDRQFEELTQTIWRQYLVSKQKV